MQQAAKLFEGVGNAMDGSWGSEKSARLVAYGFELGCDMSLPPPPVDWFHPARSVEPVSALTEKSLAEASSRGKGDALAATGSMVVLLWSIHSATRNSTSSINSPWCSHSCTKSPSKRSTSPLSPVIPLSNSVILSNSRDLALSTAVSIPNYSPSPPFSKDAAHSSSQVATKSNIFPSSVSLTPPCPLTVGPNPHSPKSSHAFPSR